jgi:hypothetical protein
MGTVSLGISVTDDDAQIAPKRPNDSQRDLALLGQTTVLPVVATVTKVRTGCLPNEYSERGQAAYRPQPHSTLHRGLAAYTPQPHSIPTEEANAV